MKMREGVAEGGGDNLRLACESGHKEEDEMKSKRKLVRVDETDGKICHRSEARETLQKDGGLKTDTRRNDHKRIPRKMKSF